MLRASCLVLEINEFRCYEPKLLWVSGRALAAQARGVLGLTPSNCLPSLISSKFIVRQDTLSTKHLYRVQQMEQYKANSIVLLSCHVNCKTHELSLTYESFPDLVTTSIVVVLQAPGGKDSG